MNNKNLEYVDTRDLTPSQARQLEYSGFILKWRYMHIDGTDTHDIYVNKGE